MPFHVQPSKRVEKATLALVIFNLVLSLALVAVEVTRALGLW